MTMDLGLASARSGGVQASTAVAARSARFNLTLKPQAINPKAGRPILFLDVNVLKSQKPQNGMGRIRPKP